MQVSDTLKKKWNRQRGEGIREERCGYERENDTAVCRTVGTVNTL